jgi:hypothetical protein
MEQPYGQSAQSYLNLIHWIDSKLHKKPVKEIMMSAV